MANSIIGQRFRGFLPVVVDVETGGFDPERDALLEIAAVILNVDDTQGWHRHETVACHVKPFEGAHLDPAALEFNGIDPHHPFRLAISEQAALKKIFDPIWKAVTAQAAR